MQDNLIDSVSTQLEDELFFDAIRSKSRIHRIVNSKSIYSFIKRFLDIVFGFIGSIFILPIAFFLKIAFLATGDFGPIFFIQKRIGRHGKVFNIYKFRSMIIDADAKLAELLKDPVITAEWEQNHKLKNDPRISKVGNFIRKTSIDEIPQFFNVLVGDMSLIGPRPLVENELKKFRGSQKIYQSIRPGITGWWAANGRSETSKKERLALEYYYIQHYSFFLDMKCIAKTIKSIVQKTGAV